MVYFPRSEPYISLSTGDVPGLGITWGLWTGPSGPRNGSGEGRRERCEEAKQKVVGFEAVSS